MLKTSSYPAIFEALAVLWLPFAKGSAVALWFWFLFAFWSLQNWCYGSCMAFVWEQAVLLKLQHFLLFSGSRLSITAKETARMSFDFEGKEVPGGDSQLHIQTPTEPIIVTSANCSSKKFWVPPGYRSSTRSKGRCLIYHSLRLITPIGQQCQEELLHHPETLKHSQWYEMSSIDRSAEHSGCRVFSVALYVEWGISGNRGPQ